MVFQSPSFQRNSRGRQLLLPKLSSEMEIYWIMNLELGVEYLLMMERGQKTEIGRIGDHSFCSLMDS